MNDQENAHSNNEESPTSSISSISTGELHPIEHSSFNIEIFSYNDSSSLSGISKAVQKNDLNKLKDLVAQGKSLRVVDNNGNTPLHLATMMSTKEKMEVFEYLLTLEDVDKNAENHYGQTPLFLSVMLSKESVAFALIEAGADVRLVSNEGVTPLHLAIRSSAKLSETLILRGADIDYVDYDGDTPLHDALTYGDLETVTMLLYYGADTEITNSGGLTPFMQSLAIGNIEFADVLFEYVADFNMETEENMSTLFLAITCGYSRVKEMIERGADVNYSSSELYNVFTLGVAPTLDAFQCIWDHFNIERAMQTNCPNILIHLLKDVHTTNYYKLTVTDIFLSSEDNKKIMYLTQDSENDPIIHPFVHKLYHMGVSQEVVHKYCATLLSYNLKVYDVDLDMVYEGYGYCELFKLLLHMDILKENVLKFNIFPYMIYQMEGDFHYLSQRLDRMFSLSESHNLNIIDYENILDHTISFPLKKWFGDVVNDSKCHKLLEYINALPQVPKLQDLASLKARDFLRVKFNTKKCSQFYTMLKHLNIPTPCKRLISFESSLYSSYVPAQFLEFRRWLKQAREVHVRYFSNARRIHRIQ